MAEEPRSQLDMLAEPFPPKLVKKAPAGKYGSYVKHSSVTERLLSIVGAYSYEIVQVVYGYAPPVIGKNHTAENPRWSGREHAVVGCIAKLTVIIDGREVSVEEAGDVDDPAMENDGRNLKDASSDAIKRCCMRLGLGLHLWSQDDYFLDRQLKHDAEPPSSEGETLEDTTEDADAQAVRDKFKKRHAEADERQQTETTEALDREQAELKKEQADNDQTPIERTDYDPEPPVADVVPITNGRPPAPSANRTPDEAKDKLEWELSLEDEGRMKCKGSCERLNPYKYDQPCCKSAHLRRLYSLAELGLQLEHSGKFKDLLHQALAKQGAAHVTELRKPALDNLIGISKDTFMEMLYGAPEQ